MHVPVFWHKALRAIRFPEVETVCAKFFFCFYDAFGEQATTANAYPGLRDGGDRLCLPHPLPFVEELRLHLLIILIVVEVVFVFILVVGFSVV